MPDNEMRDLGKNLALSDPFMQIGQAIASVGQAVQTGDVPQPVQDAYEAIKSHVMSGGKTLQDAYQTLKKHATEALTPTLQAQTDTPGTILVKPEDVQPITVRAEEVQPMNTARVNGQDVPIEDWRQAVGKGQVIFSNKVLAAGRENLPAIGGTVGQILQGPAGAAAGGMVGERLREYGRAAAGVEPLPGQLDASGRVLQQGAIQGGLALGGELLGMGMEKGAKAVYRSYLKPSLAAKLAPKAEAVVNTALEEALPVTKGGVGKAQQLISGLNQQVQDALDASKGEVDLHDVADRLRMWATKTYYKPGVSTGDYESALAVADSIDKHASLGIKALFTPTVPVTASEANASKQALQQAARHGYGLQSSATTTAQKVGASELRQAIEAQVPEVAGLNARESKLIDAARAISRAVNREGNQYKIHGTKAIVGGLVGSEEAARTGDPWSAAAKGLAVTLALQPGVATRAAIVASRLGRMSGIGPTTAARVAIAALQSDTSQEGQ